MEKSIDCCYVITKSNEFLSDEENIFFKVERLTDLPTIGDEVNFLGKLFKVESRVIEINSLIEHTPTRVTLYIKSLDV